MINSISTPSVLFDKQKNKNFINLNREKERVSRYIVMFPNSHIQIELTEMND